MLNRIGFLIRISSRYKRLLELRQNFLSAASFYHTGRSSIEAVRRYEIVKEFKEVNIDQFAELITTDQDRNRIQQILDAYETLKYETTRVPSFLRVVDMTNLLETDDTIENYMWYLCCLEARKYHKKIKAEEKRLSKPQPLYQEKDFLGVYNKNMPNYGLWGNSMFLRLRSSNSATCHLPGLIASAFFGQKLVIDFDYDDYMRMQEAKGVVNQFVRGWRHVRQLDEPFDLWFCNAKPDSRAVGYLYERLYEGDPLLKWRFNSTPNSYLDLFDREQIIYLSPNSPCEMSYFDHDAVYVVGGFVDKFGNKCVSQAKSKEDNVRSMKLPLDKHFVFKGAKCLTIDQVLGILSALKSGDSMKDSIEKFTPKRKIKSQEELAEEQVSREFNRERAERKRGKLLKDRYNSILFKDIL